MAKQETKKKDKKKLLVLVLLLFVAIGLTGYGVYSYYWTQGDFEGNSNTVTVASFDPRVTISGGSNFLGSGGGLSITCPNTETGTGTITCTGNLTVSNDGGTSVYVDVLDATAHDAVGYNGGTNGDDLSGDFSTPSLSWESATLAPGESKELTISVDVALTSDFGSSEAVERSESFEGADIGSYVSLRLKATQVH